MWKYHICLKALTFLSSKLIKKFSEDQNFIYISLSWSTKFYLDFLILKHKLSLEGFLAEKKIKEDSHNNQIENKYCWTSVFDYFKLRMQTL